MHPTSNPMPESIREETIAILNPLLADSTNLYLRAKQAHWNIKGEDFIALHKLLDEISEQALDAEDLIAERIVQLGGQALGTLESVVKYTTLPAYPAEVTAQQYHLEEMISTLKAISSGLSLATNNLLELNDQVTANMVMGINETIDKYLWFVESHTL